MVIQNDNVMNQNEYSMKLTFGSKKKVLSFVSVFYKQDMCLNEKLESYFEIIRAWHTRVNGGKEAE